MRVGWESKAVMQRQHKTQAMMTANWLATACVMLCASQAAHAQPLADPTRPVTRAASAAGVIKSSASLRVEAIFSYEQGSQHRAIVDGKLVHPGDYVGDALIEQITADAVRYIRNGRSQLALLNPNKLQVRKTAPEQLAARGDQP